MNDDIVSMTVGALTHILSKLKSDSLIWIDPETHVLRSDEDNFMILPVKKMEE